MKNMLSLSIGLLLPLLTLAEQPGPFYTEGAFLHVAATSGLRLRMAPSHSASTIRVIPFAEPVEVENTHAFDEQYAETHQWLKGHWVKVRYRGSAGYVFDSFLTSLPIPDHEAQLCFNAEDLWFSLENYIHDQFELLSIEEGPAHGEDLDQFIVKFASNVTTTKTKGDGWFKVEYAFAGYRTAEVLNLLRQMMVGDELRDKFDGSLVFHKDRSGNISRIDVNIGGTTGTVIEVHGDTVHVATTVFETDGC